MASISENYQAARFHGATITLCRGWLEGALGRASRACRASFERSAFILAKPPPDARILIGIKSVLKAVFGDRAMRAHRLRSVNLVNRWAGIPHWEKELGIHRQARCLVSPVHSAPFSKNMPCFTLELKAFTQRLHGQGICPTDCSLLKKSSAKQLSSHTFFAGWPTRPSVVWRASGPWEYGNRVRQCRCRARQKYFCVRRVSNDFGESAQKNIVGEGAVAGF